MLRSLQRLPLRRCMHSSTTRPVSALRNSRVGMAVGASAVLTTYVAWKALRSENNITLDSVTHSEREKSAPLSPQASVSPETLAASHSTALKHEPSLHETHMEKQQESLHSEPSESTASEATEGSEAAEGEEEAEGAGGAFNPVTGEINWDCPCLGGMAHGICGAQFREAFSCFVFSEKDPKGIDCVERFKAMQDCFREHPDVYGDEIMDDDDEDEEAAAAPVPATQVSAQPESEPSPTVSERRKPIPKDSPSPA